MKTIVELVENTAARLGLKLLVKKIKNIIVIWLPAI